MKLSGTQEYIENVIKTEKPEAKSLSLDESRLLHGAMGISTEAGEILDNMKKHIFYGEPIDYNNLREEIGDILWYMGIMIDTTGQSFLQIMGDNLEKLKKRFPDGFTDKKAQNRDIKHELSHFEHDTFVASKCPKCDKDAQMIITTDEETSRYRVSVSCPECGNTGPDGKDYIKALAIEKGIEEWEKMLKEGKIMKVKSSSQS